MSGPVRVAEVVEGGGLLLRPHRREDAPAVLTAFSDTEVARWSPHGLEAVDLTAIETWCELRSDWSEGRHVAWAIERDGILVGTISVHRLDFDQESAEAGYWVAAAHRRQGVASGALRLAAGYGFARLGLRRIELFHAIENVGSCKVATAAGFAYEGTHRQSYRYGDGLFHDEHSHARLASD